MRETRTLYTVVGSRGTPLCNSCTDAASGIWMPQREASKEGEQHDGRES